MTRPSSARRRSDGRRYGTNRPVERHLSLRGCASTRETAVVRGRTFHRHARQRDDVLGRRGGGSESDAKAVQSDACPQGQEDTVKHCGVCDPQQYRGMTTGPTALGHSATDPHRASVGVPAHPGPSLRSCDQLAGDPLVEARGPQQRRRHVDRRQETDDVVLDQAVGYDAWMPRSLCARLLSRCPSDRPGQRRRGGVHAGDEPQLGWPTTTPPTLCTASAAKAHSGRALLITATRSPCCTPWSTRPSAISRTRSRYVRHVIACTTPPRQWRSAMMSGSERARSSNSCGCVRIGSRFIRSITRPLRRSTPRQPRPGSGQRLRAAPLKALSSDRVRGDE